MSEETLETKLAVIGLHRAALLRLELAALLHQIGKLTESYRSGSHHLFSFVANVVADQCEVSGTDPSSYRGTTIKQMRATAAEFEEELREFLRRPLGLPPVLSDREHSTADIIEYYYLWPKIVQALTGRDTTDVISRMYVAHLQASGQEKRTFEQEQSESLAGKAERVDLELARFARAWFQSTVFGFERELSSLEYSNARSELTSLIPAFDNFVRERSGVLKRLGQSLNPFPADGQRPINDIRITDIGISTAAFFKASLAGKLLGAVDGDKQRWVLLRIAVDSGAYVSRAVRVPDILSRGARLTGLLDWMRVALEEDWVLGNEIYRDEGGPVYLVSDVFDADRKHRRELSSLFLTRWMEYADRRGDPIPFEITPELQWSNAFAMGADAGSSYQMGSLLAKELPTVKARIESVRQWWAGMGQAEEVCTVCGLRPMGPDRKSKNRKVCVVCEEGRADRSAAWTKTRDHTIWLEETADENGRIALIAARFRLDGWLAEDGYVERTLRLGQFKGKAVHKGPSFARLRRIWETTGAFWEEWTREMKTGLPRRVGRLLLRGRYEGGGEQPVSRHAYLLESGGYRLSGVCSRDRDGVVEFITSENLDRAARLLGLKGNGIEALTAWCEGRKFRVEEPTGYGSDNRRMGTVIITDVEEDATDYAPLIEITRGPTLVMVLAPASQALEGVKLAARRYEEEMGKVRNRLAMDVGVVFAQAATPLHAVLDAARTMLKGLKSEAEEWTVDEDSESGKVRFKNGAEWDVPTLLKFA